MFFLIFFPCLGLAVSVLFYLQLRRREKAHRLVAGALAGVVAVVALIFLIAGLTNFQSFDLGFVFLTVYLLFPAVISFMLYRLIKKLPRWGAIVLALVTAGALSVPLLYLTALIEWSTV